MKQFIFCSFAIALLSACAQPNGGIRQSFLGDPAPANVATTTIEIRPDTKWVNVAKGEVVQFVAGDKKFVWAFTVPSLVTSFDLNRVAPPGMLDHPVVAYISQDPDRGGEAR